jgi:hypothetical protein
MDIRHKIVTRLPLEELCNTDGLASTSRLRSLTKDEIVDLQRAGPVHFVIADVGAPLRWIPNEDSYSFWKREAMPHLAEPKSAAVLDDFPDRYRYFASEWALNSIGSAVVVLEKSH